MKKVFALFISMLLTVSLFSVTSFAAAETKLFVRSVEAAPKSEVSVPIELSDNQGLWGMMFNVYFDTDVFEVKEIVNNKDVFKSSDITIGPSDFGKGYVRVVVTPLTVNENNTSNGAICILKLNVNKNAAVKDYSFRLELSDACDIDGNSVKVNTVNGSVKVKDIKNVAQENSQNSTLKNDKDTANSDDSDVEVLAKAEDNKLIEVEHTEDLDLGVSSSDGNKSADNDNSDGASNDNEIKENSVKNDGDSSDDSIAEDGDNSNSDNNRKANAASSSSLNVSTIIICIIAIAVLIAAAVVVIVLMVKRKKK